MDETQGPNDRALQSPDISLSEPISRTIPSSSSIMSKLPDGYVVHHFSRFKLLCTCAKILVDQSQKISGLSFSACPNQLYENSMKTTVVWRGSSIGLHEKDMLGYQDSPFLRARLGHRWVY
ncbi:hypothetical protein N7530_011310 [Penicillium desertorum]|uniref:Uncharacterized protein n=1 Tax=Penicillium desertorum TaxID=1303715 RepID=A0A9X0BHI5_9EURO|nr:hypothetical protein N7530_011310 [Penicillium desertorum]